MKKSPKKNHRTTTKKTPKKISYPAKQSFFDFLKQMMTTDEKEEKEIIINTLENDEFNLLGKNHSTINLLKIYNIMDRILEPVLAWLVDNKMKNRKEYKQKLKHLNEAVIFFINKTILKKRDLTTDEENLIRSEGALEKLKKMRYTFLLMKLLSQEKEYDIPNINIQEVSQLIQNGADVNAVNKKGFTILMLAMTGKYTYYKRHLQIVETLLKAGADPNKINTQNGYTPLMLSFFAYHEKEFMELLIKYGADVNKINEKTGETPLMVASSSSSLSDLHRGLIKAGADINAINKKNGFTALMVMLNQKDIIDPNVHGLLVDNVTDVKIIGKKGETALSLAEQNEYSYAHDDITDFMEKNNIQV